MTKPKFQVGDKVKILDGSEIENYIHDWVPEMNKYIGVITTIRGIRFCKHCDGFIYSLNINDSFLDFDERGLELIEADTAVYWTEEDDDEEDAKFRAAVEKAAKKDSYLTSKLMYALIKNGVRPTLVKKSFYDPDVMRAGGIPEFIIELVNAKEGKKHE